MKKARRFFALVGALLLFLMYGCTLFFALTDSSRTMGLLKASIACTILVPVLLYGILLFYRLLRQDCDDHSDTGES